MGFGGIAFSQGCGVLQASGLEASRPKPLPRLMDGAANRGVRLLRLLVGTDQFEGPQIFKRLFYPARSPPSAAACRQPQKPARSPIYDAEGGPNARGGGLIPCWGL